MSAQLTVRYYYHKDVVEDTVTNPLYAYNLRVIVTNAIDMPKEVFVYHRGVFPATGDATESASDGFSHIATPLDLEEIPVNAPDMINEIPYFRTDMVQLSFRNVQDLKLTKEMIASDILLLVRALNQELTEMEEKVIDGTPEFDYPNND